MTLDGNDAVAFARVWLVSMELARFSLPARVSKPMRRSLAMSSAC